MTFALELLNMQAEQLKRTEDAQEKALKTLRQCAEATTEVLVTLENIAANAATFPDRGHGSPHDRGGADSYYGRWWEKPHYYKGNVRVEQADMTPAQIAEYRAGYEENEREGNKKDWGHHEG